MLTTIADMSSDIVNTPELQGALKQLFKGSNPAFGEFCFLYGF